MALIPCPFCGGKNLIVEPHYDESYVICQKCGTTGPEGSYEECQTLWNKRAITGLEEIIRQAYLIGRKDKADNRPIDQPYLLKNRVKQIKADIEWQLEKGPLKPFNYDRLT